MSRGFRDSDTTQAMSDRAIAEAIERVVHRDEEIDLRPDGRCITCGRDIGAERLQALPTAVRCVRCQADWEQAGRP